MYSLLVLNYIWLHSILFLFIHIYTRLMVNTGLGGLLSILRRTPTCLLPHCPQAAYRTLRLQPPALPREVNMGTIITTAFHCDLVYWVDILLHSSLKSQHHGLGLKERRVFGTRSIWWVAAWSPGSSVDVERVVFRRRRGSPERTILCKTLGCHHPWIAGSRQRVTFLLGSLHRVTSVSVIILEMHIL